MTFRNILGMVRQKILRFLFGRNLYANTEQLEQQKHLNLQQLNKLYCSRKLHE